MRYLSVALVVTLAVAALMGAAHTLGAGARAGAAGSAGHPLVGAWVLDLGKEGGRLFTFSSDGTVLFGDADGSSGHGTWHATGPATAALTIYKIASRPDEFDPNNRIFTGYTVITGEVTVAAAGDAWTGTFTVSTTNRPGEVVQRQGPLTARATGIPVVPADQVRTPPAPSGDE